MTAAIVALLCITVIVEGGALGAVIFYGHRALASRSVGHRFEMTGPDGRSAVLQSDRPFAREQVERMKHEFQRLVGIPTSDDVLSGLVKRRYVVTLRGGEGDFAGILTEQQIVATPHGSPELILVFEHCTTMPTHDGDTAADIAGRVILGMSGIAYVQQVG